MKGYAPHAHESVFSNRKPVYCNSASIAPPVSPAPAGFGMPAYESSRLRSLLLGQGLACTAQGCAGPMICTQRGQSGTELTDQASLPPEPFVYCEHSFFCLEQEAGFVCTVESGSVL